MIMLPSTMLSVLTVSLVSARARLTRTMVEEEEVCPAKSSRSVWPLGTWRGERKSSNIKTFNKTYDESQPGGDLQFDKVSP